jgi:hypothetical protein
MRIVLGLLAVVVGLGLFVVIVGYLLPVKHVAVVSARVPATPEQVWGALTDVAAYPQWRGDVTSVEMLPADSGHVAWRERGRTTRSRSPSSRRSRRGGWSRGSRTSRCRSAARGSTRSPPTAREPRADHRARRGLQPRVPLRVAVHHGAQRDGERVPQGIGRTVRRGGGAEIG